MIEQFLSDAFVGEEPIFIGIAGFLAVFILYKAISLLKDGK